MSFPDDALTRDIFLDGGLAIWQPKNGYRAATDPVFLAASVQAEAGQEVLELGCGAGTALLALGHRIKGLRLAGVERQSSYAELARRNSDENGIPLEVVESDLADLPLAMKRGFDHVIANPPYYPASSPAARDEGRASALREETPLNIWIETGLKRLKPGGYLTVIHLAERLPELLTAASMGAGSIKLRPLSARSGRSAGRVLIQARKGSKGRFELLAPLILHEGARHTGDHEDFTEQVRCILRKSAPLPWT